MNQREEFVLRALQPDINFRALCREFNISRKTGYKWVHRFKERGLLGLEELNRGPAPGTATIACTADVAIEILNIRKAQPTWGPKKLRVVLLRRYARGKVPSTRTIARILKRAGVVTPRKVRAKRNPNPKPYAGTEAPNDVWTVDFKGWWRAKDGKKSEPLTIRDAHSRFVFAVHLVTAPSFEQVQAVFQQLFEKYGLPLAILSDNGSPFVANRGLLGLTRLSVWWMSLGIRHLRSRVGSPQDNGGHERMHRDIAQEVERFPSLNLEQQQAHCDRWRHEFNHHRPHEALKQQTPSSVYRKSPRPLPAARTELVYPSAMEQRTISSTGTMRYRLFQRHVSSALAGHVVGVQPLPDQRFRVWFADFCIGEANLPWVAPLQPVSIEENPDAKQVFLPSSVTQTT
jgi:transposase InsO family protein